MPLDSSATTPPDLLQALCLAFGEALAQTDIGEDDDFFDLGGDSIVAVALFLHLQRLTGRECPVAAIYDAPTPRALAEFLRDPAPEFASLVTLRQPAPGSVLPPLFILHGIDGVVVALGGLAAAITDGRAVYALQARGIAPDASGQADRVEEMAAQYLPEIRAIQPNGPYLLAGYSFGGLIAFELACRLRQSGERVDRLIMLDTLCHQRSWPADARLFTTLRLLPAYFAPRALGRSLGYYAGRLRATGPRYLLRGLRRAALAPFDIQHAGFVTRMAQADERYNRPEDSSMLPAMRRVRAALEHAYRVYEPGYFDGEIDFIKASREDFLPYAPRRIWRRHARALRQQIVQSGHMSLVRENAPETGARIAALLSRTGQNAD